MLYRSKTSGKMCPLITCVKENAPYELVGLAKRCPGKMMTCALASSNCLSDDMERVRWTKGKTIWFAHGILREGRVGRACQFEK